MGRGGKMMRTTKMDSRGRVTIPSHIRDTMKLNKDHEFMVVVKRKGVGMTLVPVNLNKKEVLLMVDNTKSMKDVLRSIGKVASITESKSELFNGKIKLHVTLEGRHKEENIKRFVSKIRGVKGIEFR